MPTFILDFIADSARFVSIPQQTIGKVWIQFKVDGVERTYNTRQIDGTEYMKWGTCIRFVLNLSSLDGGHLVARFFNQPVQNNVYNEPQLLALSQVRLNELPFGKPRRLTFPLISVSNYNDVLVQLSITATISMYQFCEPKMPQPQLYHTQQQRIDCSEQRHCQPSFQTQQYMYHQRNTLLPHLTFDTQNSGKQTTQNRVHVISSQPSDKDDKTQPTIRRFEPI